MMRSRTVRLFGVGAGAVLALGVAIARHASAGDQAAAPMQKRSPAALLFDHKSRDGAAGASCTPCHTCSSPTRGNLCLRACARESLDASALPRGGGNAPAVLPPDRVMLAHLEDIYEPVAFDHKGHADMAQMSTGCTVCHHHTPEGEDHPACRSCHLDTAGHEDSAMPGLKGAYHRQCLSCHREWSHDTACNACHLPKSQRGADAAADYQPAFAAAMSRMSPPVTREDTYVYNTSHQPTPVVTFHHNDHAGSFGVSCVQCHEGDSCGRCHDATAARAELAVHADAVPLRESCFSCHAESNCNFCHDQSPRPNFDHAMHAGWPLEPNHAGVACERCHGPVDQFTIPSRTCHACHVRPHGSDTLVSTARVVRDHAGVSSPATGSTGTEGGPAATHGNATPADAARPAGSMPPHAAGDTNCLSCHAEMSSRFARASCVHGPAAGGKGCSACHDLSSPLSPRPTTVNQRELCLGCHDHAIDTGNGRPLEDIATLLEQNPNHHGPVRDGNCSACHDPHASDHARLLVGEYSPQFYASFDLKQYELCFKCHNKEHVLSESGTALTGFRDGDLNLHWLHVNRQKGRTCRACHEIHASNRPFHIRESVPFGDSGWMLPINYTQTPAGGSCAPGCHAAKTYQRTEAAGLE